LGNILYHNIYINYLHFLWAQYKWSNLTSLLDYQWKIDMGLMSENQFSSLGNNENPNRFKTWGTIIVPNMPNQKQFSLLPIWRENEGPTRSKEIWLRKIIGPTVLDHYSFCYVSIKIALWIQVFIRTPFPNNLA